MMCTSVFKIPSFLGLSMAAVALITGSAWAAEEAVLLPTKSSSSPEVESVSAQGIYVANGFVSPDAEPIAKGYSQWVRSELALSGMVILPEAPKTTASDGHSGVRAAARKAGLQHTTQEGLGLAVAASADYLLLVDMRWQLGSIAADFRLYETRSGEVRGGRSVSAPPGQLVTASGDRLWAALGWLELDPAATANERAQTMTVEDLSSAGRAVELLAEGELAEAWQEAGTAQSRVHRELRAKVDTRVADGKVSPMQSARLMVAKGQPEEAWPLISSAAREEYGTPTGNVRLLVAAGQVQLQRGEIREAKAYHTKALELAPKNPAASLGLGRVYLEESRIDDARRAFRHSARYDTRSTEPLKQWAKLETSDTTMRAKVLMAAGKRSAAYLRTKSANEIFKHVVTIEPKYAPVIAEQTGELQAKLGNHPLALRSYKAAIKDGGVTPARLLGVARAQKGTKQLEAAEQTYLEVLEPTLAPDNVDAHLELGQLYSETERYSEAVPHLERAVELVPNSVAPKKGLARVLHSVGAPEDLDRARQLYGEASKISALDYRDYKDLAAIQRVQGDLAGAQHSLEMAVKDREIDIEANEALADVVEERGDIVTANLIRERLAFYGSSNYATIASTENISAGGLKTSDVMAGTLQELLMSIEVTGGPVGRVAVLPVRPGEKLSGAVNEASLVDRVRNWFSPRTPKLDAIDQEIVEFLVGGHDVLTLETVDVSLAGDAEALLAFDQESSLDALAVAELNGGLDVEAVFLGRVSLEAGDPKAAAEECIATPHFKIELRRLDGQREKSVQMIAQSACLAGGLSGSYAAWNFQPIGFSALALLVLLYPPLRGWGTVKVKFDLPPETKALFSVSLRRRPAAVKDRSKGVATVNASFFERELRARSKLSLHRFTKALEGEEVVFRWVPAKFTPFYVVVRGPIVDLKSNETIGEMLQEKTLRVRRGRVNLSNFDMRNEESAVTLSVKLDGQPVPRCRVGLKGMPSSFRVARDGDGLVYAPIGQHTVQVGAGDRVAEFPLEVETAAPLSLVVELTSEEILLFQGCREAVDPYLDGDIAQAAHLLEEAGLPDVASGLGPAS